MRSLCKILFLSLVILSLSKDACCQYVQPMGYKDYSFWDQVNIGNQDAKLTHASAFLELGKAAGSKKGFLLPRGNKDSIVSPAYGLMIFNTPDSLPYWFNGAAWRTYSSGGGSGSGGYPTALNYNSNVLTLSRSGLPDLIATLPFSSKLNVADTAGKWVSTVYARNDSVFYRKGAIETFVYTDAAAGGAWVPVARTISINGITQDLSANRTFGPYLTGADTTWLHNTLVNIQTTTDNTTFNSPLYRIGSAVNVHYETPSWNANRIQSYYVDATTPHNGYFMGFDSTAGVIKWLKPDSVVGSMPTHGIDDVLAIGQNLTASRNINTAGSYKLQIGNAFPSATSGFQVDLTSNGSDATGDVYYRTSNGPMGRLPIGTTGQVLTVIGGLPSWQPSTAGSTPTLQMVTTAGNSTTDSLLINSATLKRTTGNNVAFGKYSLRYATGKWNTAIGDSALAGVNTGYANTAIGYQSQESGNGIGNTSVGRWALESITTAFSNTAIGVNAGDLMTTGAHNTFLGDNTAQTLTTGSNNTFVGSLAGANIQTGSYNTLIGTILSQTYGDFSHRIMIGDGSSTRLEIDSVGLYKFYTYGTGTHTGTAAYSLSVDASGHVIETTAGGGGSSKFARVFSGTSESTTSGTTILTCYTDTLLANTLVNDGDGLVFEIAIAMSGFDEKRVELAIGTWSTYIYDQSTNNQARIRVSIIKTGSLSFKWTIQSWDVNGSNNPTTSSNSLSGSGWAADEIITLKLECPAGTGSITSKYMYVNKELQ